MRLKTLIKIIKWLVRQKCAFNGHDEANTSSNLCNFIEIMIKLLALMNENMKKKKSYLKLCSRNTKYMSSIIQKEILKIIANNVRNKIHYEVGNVNFFYFC